MLLHPLEQLELRALGLLEQRDSGPRWTTGHGYTGSRPRSRSTILIFEWQPWIRIGMTVGRIAMTAVVSLRDPERAVVPVVVPTLTKYP